MCRFGDAVEFECGSELSEVIVLCCTVELNVFR